MIGRAQELDALGAVAALRTVVNARGERIAEEPAPLVIVYGGASTGKSMCVAQTLRRHAELYAMVDCTAIYSAQEFYREILVQLYKNLRHASTHQANANGAAQAADQRDECGDVGEQDEVLIQGDGHSGGADDVTQSRTACRRDHADSDSDDSSSQVSSGHSDADDSDRQHAANARRNSNSSSEQSTVARAKRVRAQQREQQEQRDADASSTHVSYEGYNSLNFLSFIKALGKFVAAATTQDATAAAPQDEADAQPRKRVVYLALDQVDKLLDRGLAPLLTCIFTINDHLAYLHMFSGVTWDVSALLITRALSLEFDRLVSAFFPAYIAFPPYTKEQVADILVEQLQMQPVARVFRRWLLHLSSLVPASQGDWLEFRRNVVHLLPDFHAFFAVATGPSTVTTAPTASVTDDKLVKKLMRTTNERASAFEKTRRKHLFGYNKLQRSGGDPTDTIACTDLSRSCLLLVVAGYLASFNPQETDTNFLSSSGGVRRKKRVKKTGQSSAAAAEQISQFLIGPRIFTLQRLLAIYLNLRAEATADISDQFAPTDAREDIFIHLATLVRMQLFQRTSPPTMLDDIKFRCLADSRFVHETAKYLRFPLESYLNTGT